MQIVISCVRLLCERLLYVEPPSLSVAISNLRLVCKPRGNHSDSIAESDDNQGLDRLDAAPDDVIESRDDLATNDGDNIDGILSALELVRKGVDHLVLLYSLSLLPGYRPDWWVEPQVRKIFQDGLKFTMSVYMVILFNSFCTG